MVGGNFHPLHEIETMRVEALDTRIELEVFAILHPRLLDQPIEKLAPESSRTIIRPCHQIVDIHKAAGEERFKYAITGDCADFVPRFEECEQITAALLSSDTPNELFPSAELRPQFPHDRMATCDLRRSFGDANPRHRGAR